MTMPFSVAYISEIVLKLLNFLNIFSNGQFSLQPGLPNSILTDKGSGESTILFDQYLWNALKHLKAVIIIVRNYKPAVTQHRQGGRSNKLSKVATSPPKFSKKSSI